MVRNKEHDAEPPEGQDLPALDAMAPQRKPEPWVTRRCQRVGAVWKGDPPRGLPSCAGVCGVHAHDRGGRVDLRDSGDGGAGRASGSPSELRPSSAGCSRRGRGRSACRWRRWSRSEGISPISASPSGDPRPTFCPDEATADDTSGSGKTCDNPGWSSLCAFEDRGLSTRGLGGATPGPHSVLGTVGHPCACTRRTLPP
jgi:hypothetical protein